MSWEQRQRWPITPNETVAPDAAELDAVRAKLEATEQELANYKLRLADFENARKRLLRDAEVERKYAAEPLARDLLAALDNLDRAPGGREGGRRHRPTGDGRGRDGRRSSTCSERHGVTRIDVRARDRRSTRTCTRP